MKRIFRSVKFGVANLISWLPVIWNDRNWDYWFIYVIIRKKLDNTRQSLKKYHNHVHWERDYDNISKVVFALDRLIKNNYSDMVYKELEEEFGELNLSSEKIENKNLYQLMFTRDKVDYSNEKQVERLERKTKQAINREKYLREQDKKFVFSEMCKHIEEWWD